MQISALLFVKTGQEAEGRSNPPLLSVLWDSICRFLKDKKAFYWQKKIEKNEKMKKQCSQQAEIDE